MVTAGRAPGSRPSPWPPQDSCRGSSGRRCPGRLRVAGVDPRDTAAGGRAARARRDRVLDAGEPALGVEAHGPRGARVRAGEPRRAARRDGRPDRRELERLGIAAPGRPRARSRCPAASSSGWRSPASSRWAPRLLVLDEPTAQLDPAGTVAVAGLLARAGRRRHDDPVRRARSRRPGRDGPLPRPRRGRRGRDAAPAGRSRRGARADRARAADARPAGRAAGRAGRATRSTRPAIAAALGAPRPRVGGLAGSAATRATPAARLAARRRRAPGPSRHAARAPLPGRIDGAATASTSTVEPARRSRSSARTARARRRS